MDATYMDNVQVTYDEGLIQNNDTDKNNDNNGDCDDNTNTNNTKDTSSDGNDILDKMDTIYDCLCLSCNGSNGVTRM